MQREVRPWLLSITRHRAIDATRGRHYWQHTQTVYLYNDVIVDADPTTRTLLDQLQLRAALSTLPHNQRTTIELAYQRGFTCEEIATHQGLPVGTVKTRLRLALVKLREIFGQWQDHDDISQR